MPKVPAMLRGVEARAARRARRRSSPSQGRPTEIAGDVALLLDAFPLLDVVEIAAPARRSAPRRSRELYYVLSDRYDVDTFLTRITAAAARRPLVGARALVAALRPVRGDRAASPRRSLHADRRRR